jgi:hypothetical protein
MKRALLILSMLTPAWGQDISPGRMVAKLLSGILYALYDVDNCKR